MNEFYVRQSMAGILKARVKNLGYQSQSEVKSQETATQRPFEANQTKESPHSMGAAGLFGTELVTNSHAAHCKFPLIPLPARGG